MIDITKNAQLQPVDYKGYVPCRSLRSYKPDPEPYMKNIQKAAELINYAEKPFIISGQGIMLGKAEQEFLEFAE